MRRIVLLWLVVFSLWVALAVPAMAAPANLDTVSVSGNPGEKPVITLAKPLTVKSTMSDVVSRGQGANSAKGSTLTFDYVILNGRTGQEIESSYGKAPATMFLDPKQAQPVLVKRLVGTPVGSRVLIAIAPGDGLAQSAGVPGLKKTDTILFFFELERLSTPLHRATGESVAPVSGLPSVALAASGRPKIKVPTSAPPQELVAQPLIKGAGPAVTAGQTITVHYTGVVWNTGRTFDSSWTRGSPSSIPIGTGAIVQGWDEGLVGQTVGSQVLLVIPPDKGYGASGNPQIGIAGTDTLVFVVDILGAS